MAVEVLYELEELVGGKGAVNGVDERVVGGGLPLLLPVFVYCGEMFLAEAGMLKGRGLLWRYMGTRVSGLDLPCVLRHTKTK